LDAESSGSVRWFTAIGFLWSLWRPRFEDPIIQSRYDHVEQEEHDEPDGDPSPLDEGERNDLEEVVKWCVQHCELDEE
jgi:hypothetical protein